MANIGYMRPHSPSVPSLDQAGSRRNSNVDDHQSSDTTTSRFGINSTNFKRLYSDFLHFCLPLIVSIVGIIFTVLSLLASWKSLDAAIKANQWAYYGYEAALVQIRVSLMELCLDSPPLYKATCDLVQQWDYLPSVYTNYHPDGMQQAPAVSVPVQNNVSRTTVVVACFGAVVAVVPLVAVAILARGVVRGKHAGTKEVV